MYRFEASIGVFAAAVEGPSEPTNPGCRSMEVRR